MKKTDMFYLAVVQSVLLYGSDTWVLTVPMFKDLERAHIGFARGIAWVNPRREVEGRWVYPHLAETLRAVGLKSIGTYSGRRQNTVADRLATRPILDLCPRAESQQEKDKRDGYFGTRWYH